ncbi:MAG: MmcQ/YjbR family DNA-binding protein [Verrucomicrobia bacterium]|nr:MmcQ/YjbR family DNA-binding protein [Verrucomicrobiota bacterium]
MYAEDVRKVLLSKEHVFEETPFGPEVLVYKVGGKMFALLTIEEVPVRMNLKCDPERSLDLRDRHESIIPGYHMNKKHWNTLVLDQMLPERLIRELIDHSYDLVFASLTKKVKESLDMR